MRYVKITAIIGSALLILCSCGQRGPLYSPDTAPSTTQPANTEASTSAPVLEPLSEGA